MASLKSIRQAYGDHLVYSNLSLEVEKQERIALVGPNGAGKSTLLKILASLVPIEDGDRELGHNVSVGYFSQQRVEVLNLEQSVLMRLWKVRIQVSTNKMPVPYWVLSFFGGMMFSKK